MPSTCWATDASYRSASCGAGFHTLATDVHDTNIHPHFTDKEAQAQGSKALEHTQPPQATLLTLQWVNDSQGQLALVPSEGGLSLPPPHKDAHLHYFYDCQE